MFACGTYATVEAEVSSQSHGHQKMSQGFSKQRQAEEWKTKQGTSNFGRGSPLSTSAEKAFVHFVFQAQGKLKCVCEVGRGAK